MRWNWNRHSHWLNWLLSIFHSIVIIIIVINRFDSSNKWLRQIEYDVGVAIVSCFKYRETNKYSNGSYHRWRDLFTYQALQHYYYGIYWIILFVSRINSISIPSIIIIKKSIFGKIASIWTSIEICFPSFWYKYPILDTRDEQIYEIVCEFKVEFIMMLEPR